MIRNSICAVAVALLLGWHVSVQSEERPNVVIIMADDMGYSDIGCYGGEIHTPNLDGLAARGLRLTQFYNTARCCPTRAALLTGLHQHQTGIGAMTETPKGPRDDDRPAYQGYLNRQCVTLAEVLQPAGYHTYMAGKWHLGYHGIEKWPRQRGFEHFYGSIAGATSYFKPQGGRGVTLENENLDPPKDPDYYTTDAFTDYAINFLDGQSDDRPFFLYLAYTAPHWPLHAREADIAKYVGKYREIGWDKLREQRLARQKEMGIVQDWVQLPPRDEGARAWSSLSAKQRDQLDYRMAVYAAMVDRMDQNIGRVVTWLKDNDQLDNTLIFFLSDNGGCAEPYKDLGGGAFKDINNPNKSSAISYGQGWANASNTPYRKFKVFSHEGGISTPLIIHWPQGLKAEAGSISHTPAQLIDLVPTVLDATGAKYPKRYAGNEIHPLEGVSLKPTILGEHRDAAEWMYWEHAGHKAVRHKDYKAILPRGSRSWQLYDLANDRQEMHDLAEKMPERTKRMSDQWERWAVAHDVIQDAEKAADASKSPTHEMAERIASHNEAVQLFDEKIRDPFIARGPEGNFYLTGTTAGSHWGDQIGIRVWKSPNLIDWEDLGFVWDLKKDGMRQPSWHLDRPAKQGVKNGRAIWAPEIHHLHGTWWIPHSVNVSGHGLLKSTTGRPEGPYVAYPAVADRGIDAHLYQEHGRTFYLWGSNHLVELAADLSKPVGEIEQLKPESNHELGYEGVLLKKIGDKYLLIASGRYGYELSDTYDLYYCVAESLLGPYGPRRMAVKNAGHGNLFQDNDGRWWCTAFDHEFVTSDNRWTPWIVPVDLVETEDDIEIHVLDKRFRPSEADQRQIAELNESGIPSGREGKKPWDR